MSMRLEQKNKQDLKQSLIFNLSCEIEQKLGKFEKQILEKVEFVDLALDLEESEYHIEMFKNLIMKESNDKDSLISLIVKSEYKNIVDIKKIIIESFTQGDTSFDLGMNRNVDLITIIFDDNQFFTTTISLDKEIFNDIKDSPSFKETQILKNIDSTKVWAVQKYLASIEINEKGKKKFLICKEYLEGQMLANIIVNLEISEQTYGRTNMEKLAYATGKTFSNILNELGGVPSDSNPLNLIVNDFMETKEIIVRYCDVEELRTKPIEIKHEINLMCNSFGSFAENFKKGISENYKGKKILF